MTRRKIAFLFFALVALLALAITRAWWPPLLAVLGDNATLVMVIVAILGLLVAAVAALGQWSSVFRPTAPATDPTALLQPVTLETLKSTFRDVKGQEFQYINRGATRPTALLAARRVVIVGPQKVGKSREAVELISRALEYCHIPPTRIFRPTNNLRALPPDAVASQIAKDVTTDDALLLFIDDLPYAFRGDEFEQLAAALRALERGQALYVVATAREDQLDERGRAWLAAQRFETIPLGRWSQEQIAGLVDDGIYLIETPVDTSGRAALIEGNDGTTELTRITLLGLADDDRTDRASVEEIQKVTYTLMWRDTRARLIEQQPEVEALLRAVATFYIVRVTPYTELVLALAAQSISGSKRLQRLRAALLRLQYYGLREEDGRLQFPEYMAEADKTTSEYNERARLASFILRYRPWLLIPGIGLLSGSTDHKVAVTITLAVSRGGIDGRTRQILLDSVGLMKPVYGILWSLGFVFSILRLYTIATMAYDTAIQKEPTFPMAYHNRGSLYARRNRLDSALADYDAAIRLEASDAAAYNNRGILHAHQGRPAEALADFDAAIRLDPNDAKAYHNRALLHAATGRPDAALADYDSAIRLDPSDAKAYYNRALLQAAAGRPDAALANYDAAIRLDPGYVLAYANRGNLHARQSRLDAALADYDEVIRLDPGYIPAYGNRGNLHRDQGRLDAALADYDKVIRLDPGDAKAYHNRAVLHNNAGRPDVALADYDTAIRLDPGLALGYFNRAVLYANASRPDAALADYNAAIRLNPDDAAVYNNRGLLHAGQGRPTEALADFDAAICLNPDDDDAYYNRGMLLIELGRLAEAVRDFEERLRLGQDTAGIHLNLAGIYHDLGRTDDAARHLALARERLTDDDTYNRACLEAIAGNNDLALHLLAQALAEGKADPAWVRRDPDWRLLRDDPRFCRLLGDEA